VSRYRDNNNKRQIDYSTIAICIQLIGFLGLVFILVDIDAFLLFCGIVITALVAFGIVVVWKYV
jgi:hypothetical protein